MKLVVTLLCCLSFLGGRAHQFKPWSCAKRDYVELSKLEISEEIMVTEGGISDAYCTGVVRVDSNEIELENGVVVKLGNKAKMGNNMQCNMQCQMNKQMTQMQASFSSSSSWSRKSSWKKSYSSRRRKQQARKQQQVNTQQQQQKKQVSNKLVDGSIPGSEAACDVCAEDNSQPASKSNSNLQVDIELSNNGQTKNYQLQDQSDQMPSGVNIEANIGPAGKMDAQVQVNRMANRRQSFQRKVSNKKNFGNSMMSNMGMNTGMNMGNGCMGSFCNSMNNNGFQMKSNFQFGNMGGMNMNNMGGMNMNNMGGMQMSNGFGSNMGMQMQMSSNFGSSMGSNFGSSMNSNFGSNMGGSSCMSGYFSMNGGCKKKLTENDCCKVFGADNTCLSS